MKKNIAAVITAIMMFAAPALADFQTVRDQSQFIDLVNGKTLTRPLVSLRVTPAGNISGKGAAWSVSGNWTWQNGYFCRSLEWGGDDMGYNCQEVESNGERIRFTSDQGAGSSAEFRLR